MPTVPAPLIYEGRFNAFALLPESRKLDTEFYTVSALLQAGPKNLFYAPLGNNERTGIRDFRCRLSSFVNVPIAQHLCAFIASRRQVKEAVSQNHIDHSEVIQDLQAAGLQTLPHEPAK